MLWALATYVCLNIANQNVRLCRYDSVELASPTGKLLSCPCRRKEYSEAHEVAHGRMDLNISARLFQILLRCARCLPASTPTLRSYLRASKACPYRLWWLCFRLSQHCWREETRGPKTRIPCWSCVVPNGFCVANYATTVYQQLFRRILRQKRKTERMRMECGVGNAMTTGFYKHAELRCRVTPYVSTLPTFIIILMCHEYVLRFIVILSASCAPAHYIGHLPMQYCKNYRWN